MLKVSEQNLISQISKAGLPAIFLFSLMGLFWGSKVSCGIACGGLLGFFSFWSLTGAVPYILRARRPKFRFLVLWLIKFPLLAILIYWFLSRQFVDVIGFCAGLAILPAIITLLTLRARRETA